MFCYLCYFKMQKEVQFWYYSVLSKYVKRNFKISTIEIIVCSQFFYIGYYSILCHNDDLNSKKSQVIENYRMFVLTFATTFMLSMSAKKKRSR